MPRGHPSSQRGNLEMLWELCLGDFSRPEMTKPKAISSKFSPNSEVTLLPEGWRPLKVLSKQNDSTTHFNLHLLQFCFIFLKYAQIEPYTMFQRISSRIYKVILKPS